VLFSATLLCGVLRITHSQLSASGAGLLICSPVGSLVIRADLRMAAASTAFGGKLFQNQLRHTTFNDANIFEAFFSNNLSNENAELKKNTANSQPHCLLFTSAS
jgi:hypothetical protein